MKKYFKKIAYTVISTKFVVFCTATAMLYFGKLDSYSWVIAAVAFISVNLLQKIYAPKGDKNGND